ncbi:MAG: GGDEF domain-containing protein [Treponema sp.]|uniref:GGDEF domain-containing protein n=1 Tax=Treponema sp. TaxID=166 RepID=UPI002A913974|nr:GGDEF domain-containing protein [Treponema sp.]MDY6398964.1 GGDEF domain-containing protein [Treponema sp.]
MTARSFNYYGYTKESYMECSEMIRTTNRKHTTILNTWFILINLLYLVFSYLNLFGVNQERIPFYAAYLLVGIIFELWLTVFPKTAEKHNYITVFSSIIGLLSYGILTSIFAPYMPATMFLVLLSLTALSYIGNMAIMISVSIVGVGIFLTTSYLYKTFSIAYNDTYNAVVVMTLVFGLHYTFQRTRVSQFILYQRDLQIQRELEIKSSFDALTTLLNRGRFFAITEEILRSKTNEYITLCILDLDEFKGINDNLGHQMGDKVIQTVGKTLIKQLGIESYISEMISSWDLKPKISIAGRLGGDEFILFIRGKKTQDEVRELLQNILDSLNKVQFDRLNGIHASLGVTEITSTDRDIDNAYKRADIALYESKRAGKNQIHFSTVTTTGDA